MAPAVLYRRLLGGAMALYSLWAGLLIWQNPGLQYDEALLVLGSVHMRHSHTELTLPHDPDTWVSVPRRQIPLMTARYVGAVKEYLCLPIFALFGTDAEVLRIVSALLGILGLWGLARLISEQVSPIAGASVACVLAMNPAYIDMTVFDNGTVSIWMGAMGLLALASNRYLRLKTAQAAFWLGAAAGFGIWARANFLWLIGAIAIAAIVVLRGRISAPLSHWASGVIGCLVGGAPFLIYQIVSRGGTWQTFDLLSSNASLSRRLALRIVLLGEALLADREHRAMWSGPAMPVWQRWLTLGVVLAACLVCLIAAGAWDRAYARWARGATLSMLFLAAILFATRMPIAEHHLVALVPIAAVIVVLASLVLWRNRVGRAIVAGVGVLYLCAALYWQVSTIHGLWKTGGVGPWSDAVFELSQYLQQSYPRQEIKILDWGLQNNLYVLSDGAIKSREIYGDATEERTSTYRLWTDEIRVGGVFLLNAAGNRQFPLASQAFLSALGSAHPGVRRLTVWQQNDLPYAEIIEIQPDPR
jgi:hypothetical protein